MEALAHTGRTPDEDLVGELSRNHTAAEEVFGRLEELPPRDERRGAAAGQVVIELVRLIAGEERYLCPVLRTRAPDGAALADRLAERHERIERLLRETEASGFGTEAFERLMTRTVGEARLHLRDERDIVFPRLTKLLTQEELRDLDCEIRRMRAAVPTRAHPAADDSPAPRGPSAPEPGMVDRVRVVLASWCDRS